MRLILASTSPRRKELLALLGLPFEVRSPHFEERIIPGRPAADLAAFFARGKAQTVAAKDPEALVLGSDTVIELDGAVFGKPNDLAEAETMLCRMAGREHLVHTAVSIRCVARALDRTELSTARVRMKPYDPGRLNRYLATGESLGKAGAYSIQGDGVELIESLDGDFPTVVGLPLKLVAEILTQAGFPVSADLDQVYRTAGYGTWSRFKRGIES
jgi:septum formation protein